MAQASLYNLTETTHKTAYPAISPTRPELSQEGKTVLVTGGATGIGFAIAKAFSEAAAARVVIVGRREEVVEQAVKKLSDYASEIGSKTVFIARPADVASLSSTERLWAGLEDEGICVDVLVLSASSLSGAGTILDRGIELLWGDYKANVRALVDFTARFHGQKGAGVLGRKYVVNVSSAAAHMLETGAAERPGYSASKNTGILVLQQIAKDVEPEVMQILSFHPGAIFTEGAQTAGYAETSLAWDDASLPGCFAVWAASPEAAFLHGRFVWAAWDVQQLRTGETGTRITSEPGYLKVGVIGL